MSGHFDDHLHTCGYCGVVRDEPCSHFVSKEAATRVCRNQHLAAIPPQQQRLEAPADNRIQIGPLDI